MDPKLIYVGNTDTNAVSKEGLIRLMAEVEMAIAHNQPLCFVGAHPGRFFCSGFDLSELKKLPLPEVQQHFERFLSLLRLVFTAPVPVFCQAQGHAVGIGAALCLAADVTGLTQRAKFRFPEVLLGLTLFSDVVDLLHYRLNAPKKAEEVLLQAPAFTAAQALQLGLIDVVLDEAILHLPVQDYCAQFFTPAYGGMKQLCRSQQLQTPVANQVSFFMQSWERQILHSET